MSRAVHTFVLINPKNYEYMINSIISNHGFKLREEDGEDVWVNESEENDFSQYIKLSYFDTALVISLWVKFKDDENKHREYSLDLCKNDIEKAKNIFDTIFELDQIYGDRVKRETLWVLG